MRIARDVISFGAGATVGVVTSSFVKQYDMNIPLIGDYLPYPWGNLSTIGQILIGGGTFALSQFTNLIRNADLNNFLTCFGITFAITGVMNGLFPGPAPLRARTARLAPRAQARVAPITQTGIPAARVLA